MDIISDMWNALIVSADIGLKTLGRRNEMIHEVKYGNVYKTDWTKFEFFNFRKEGIFYPLPCIEFTKWEYTNPGWSRIKIFWLWYVIGWGLFTAEKEEEDDLPV